MTRKAVKGSVIADLLAENPINDYEALDFEFPDEYINAVGDDAEGQNDVWEIYFDRAVNLAGNGIGAVLVTPDGRHFPIAVKLREYPPGVSRNEKRMIRRLAMRYFPSGEILYKISSNDELLSCINAKEARRILLETHEGNCATHSNGYMMAKQILRRGYF
ncbi:uncharacterized protein LOC131183190 [Hevea brasiliensis]|uniref:uncharacterized protein LOC131183190 n=1 Tax=Hevea brasiliensis TaxID=3981 RepID=UPI0025E31B42|nr:uncharacterized protein LOC131183190 [Hevea brasiliensis]